MAKHRGSRLQPCSVTDHLCVTGKAVTLSDSLPICVMGSSSSFLHGVLGRLLSDSQVSERSLAQTKGSVGASRYE